MSKNAFISKYVSNADKIIESKDIEEAKMYVRETIAVFESEIPNISMHLDYIDTNKTIKDYINDVKIIKSHLENYRVNLKNGIANIKEKGQTINVNASNSNTNNISNVITINMKIDEIRENIRDNTYLGEKEKEELLLKLKEIEELQKSKESRTQKWNIAKDILGFIVDKGADIAIMYIPQILKAIY